MKYLFLVLSLSLSTLALAQNEVAFQVNEKLGKGINLGNMFEAPSEGAWGNPFHEEYLDAIAELGFDHIRIPIRWDTPERTSMQAPYTINPDFFERISGVVERALDKGLMVVMNMHHHDLLFEAPAQHKARFLAQWEQISAFFKDYPEELLFEVMNEPHNQLTPDLWNEYFAEALEKIREENPERVVLMGTAEFGGISGLFSLVPPDDENLIVTVHYYNPFQFTHQGADWVGGNSQEWLGTQWFNLDAEREAIVNELDAVVRFSENHQVPIHMGEFGAYEKADMPSRLLWTNFVARYMESLGFSWAYWEWSAGFGIFDPVTNSLRQELADALLYDPMSEPQESYPETMLETTFEVDDGGWNLQTQSGAQASLVRQENQLQATIQHLGTEPWHVQLSRGGITLNEGLIYRVSFTASADENMTISHHLGRSSTPFGDFTGFNSYQIDTETRDFSYVFTMNSPSDDQARAVFDIGNKTSTFRLESFSLEKLNFLVASLPSQNPEKLKPLFPNPFEDHLHIPNGKSGEEVEIFDLQGRGIGTFTLTENGNLHLPQLHSGNYILRVKNRPGNWWRAIKK